MKLYNCNDILNSKVTSFHELIKVAQNHTSIQGIKPEDYLIINLYLKGEAVYETEDAKFKISPNFITVTHPGEEHTLQLEQVNKQCTLIYTPEYISDFVNSFMQKEQNLLDNPFNPNKSTLEFKNTLFTEKWDTVALINNIFSMIGQKTVQDLTLLSEICFQEALLSIVKNDMFSRIMMKEQEETTKTINDESGKRIRIAMDYINDNYNNNITIDQLATISNLSKYHFSRLFKKITNQSPYQYLAHKRIENAKMYLKNSHLTITEIAFEVGFSNVSAFVRLFSKIVGFSPSSFRKN